MIASYVFALTGLIATTVAEAEIENALFEVGISADTHKHDAPVEKRDDASKLRCATSVILDLMPDMPTNSAFSSWIESAGADRVDVSTCTVTVPSSFSDDYLSYYSTLTDWLSTVSDDAAKATDCGMDGSLYLTLTPLCSTSRTVIWEGATPTTGTAASTALPTVNIPTETIFIGSASSSRGLVGASVALAAFAAAFLAL
jgi:hypothetical protein